jgi:hypothetical protein
MTPLVSLGYSRASSLITGLETVGIPRSSSSAPLPNQPAMSRASDTYRGAANPMTHDRPDGYFPTTRWSGAPLCYHGCPLCHRRIETPELAKIDYQAPADSGFIRSPLTDPEPNRL